MDRTTQISHLLDLANDKSRGGRSTLLTAIKDLYADQDRRLTRQDRAMMADIMHKLVHSVEVSVRQNLAEHIAGQADAPKDLVLALANDEFSVAQTVLLQSEVLKDAELLEIICYRTMEHRVAVAARNYVSPQVSDALVETGEEKVVSSLLANRGARISDQTMGRLVRDARQIESYREPLARRPDLSAGLVRKLYGFVSQALREQIVENYDIDPAQLDQTLETALADVVDWEIGAAREVEVPPRFLEEAADGEEHALLKLLRGGHVAVFLDWMTLASKLPLQTVRMILFEPGGTALAVLCKAIGLDKHTFVSILIRFRQGRLGEMQLIEDEMTNAVKHYDNTTPDGAQSLIRHWRKNPDIQESMRKIGEALN